MGIYGQKWKMRKVKDVAKQVIEAGTVVATMATVAHAFVYTKYGKIFTVLGMVGGFGLGVHLAPKVSESTLVWLDNTIDCIDDNVKIQKCSEEDMDEA